MLKKLWHQVRLLDPVAQIDRLSDLLTIDGKIAAIGAQITDIPSDTEIINGQGLICGPGLTDLYSYTGEPGFESRETLVSLQKAAISGGFTRIAILPRMQPILDDPSVVTFMEKMPKKSGLLQLYLWGALTVETKGEKMTELAELAAAGVVGFTDGLPINHTSLLRRLLEYVKPFQKPIALWPCDRTLMGNGTIREGEESLRLGLPGDPAISETSALASLLEIVASINTPVHIMRVSCRRSVELIKEAKKRGLPITASTTWMHLLLDTSALNGQYQNYIFTPYDPSLKLAPPLGNASDKIALIEGVKEGIIDAIAIDHQPYTYEEKMLAFGETPPGAIGLELALPLLWENLVSTEKLSPLQLWAALSSQALLCLNQTPKPISLETGNDLMIFNPDQKWQVERSSLNSLADNTPWFRQLITGKIVSTGGVDFGTENLTN